MKEACGTHPQIQRWPRPRTEVPSMQGLLVKIWHQKDCCYRWFLLCLSPSHPHPTSLLGIDSILRWVLPPRCQMANQQRQAFSTQNTSWAIEVSFPGQSSRRPNRSSDWSWNESVTVARICDAMISQLGTLIHPLNQDLTAPILLV